MTNFNCSRLTGYEVVLSPIDNWLIVGNRTVYCKDLHEVATLLDSLDDRWELMGVYKYKAPKLEDWRGFIKEDSKLEKGKEKEQ